MGFVWSQNLLALAWVTLCPLVNLAVETGTKPTRSMSKITE